MGDNVNNVRHETSRTFRNKKGGEGDIWKTKLTSLKQRARTKIFRLDCLHIPTVF
jgi:hypothetical protein